MKKQVLFAVITMSLAALLPLVAVEIALQIVGVYGALQKQVVNQDNPIRRYVPNQEFHYTYGRLFESSNSGVVNNDGFVNDQSYESEGSLPLLAVIGDSYVEAVMVPYPETTHGRLARDLAGRARVYSFGMYSAALSDYLAYAEYARDRYHPVALLVIVVGNDFDQSLIAYRNLPGYRGYVALPDGRLRHVMNEYDPNIIRRMLEKSALVRYLFIYSADLRKLYRRLLSQQYDVINTMSADYDETRLRLSKQLVDLFLTALPRSAGVPPENIVLAVDGIRPALYCDACPQGAEDSFFKVMRSFLIAEAERRGFETVDMQPIFQESYRRTGQRFETDVDSHWTSRGHAVVADAVMRTRMINRLFPGP